MSDQVRQQAQDIAARACYAHEATIRALDAEVQRLTTDRGRLLVGLIEAQRLLTQLLMRELGRSVAEAKPAETPAESADRIKEGRV